MSDTDLAAVLGRGWKIILAFALASAAFAAAVSFAFPLKYSATSRLLVIQRSLSQTDPYTAMKASERISDNLAQVLYTTSFHDKVMEAKYNLDRDYFPEDERKRRKLWGKTIGTRVARGSGMLDVVVYHPDPEQAEQLSHAIAFVLTTEGWEYVGGGDMQIRLVDEPLVSRWPVRPNVPANAFTGLTLGAMAGAGYVLTVRHRRRSLFRGR